MFKSEDRAETRSTLIAALERNWRVEKEGAATYRQLAEREPDARRKDILLHLAAGEEKHAERWANRLRELGGTVPTDAPGSADWLTSGVPLESALRRLENTEDEHVRAYEEQARRLNDAPSIEIIRDAVRDEQSHSRTLHAMTRTSIGDVKPRLDRILDREKWHTRTGSWVGDAIYGANDGLGAVFGIVSGVAGATTNQSHYVLIAGLAGAIASALSMGSGAYLATKSEGEIHRADLARERAEIEEHPEEEIEELELFYQLKGLSPDEARSVVQRIAHDKEQLIQTLAQEELGISEERIPNPLLSAVSASVSTFFGAIIPVLPFFFLGGFSAVMVAAAVSLVAHFAVGAGKTLITGRSIWISGGEMTLVGAVEGVITYFVGTAIGPYMG